MESGEIVICRTMAEYTVYSYSCVFDVTLYYVLWD